MTLTPENEHRLEFLSRVAHAELRGRATTCICAARTPTAGRSGCAMAAGPDRVVRAAHDPPELPTTDLALRAARAESST
jgi:hypothetical protein